MQLNGMLIARSGPERARVINTQFRLAYCVYIILAYTGMYVVGFLRECADRWHRSLRILGREHRNKRLYERTIGHDPSLVNFFSSHYLRVTPVQ